MAEAREGEMGRQRDSGGEARVGEHMMEVKKACRNIRQRRVTPSTSMYFLFLLSSRSEFSFLLHSNIVSEAMSCLHV